jgi:type II secretion system protein G
MQKLFKRIGENKGFTLIELSIVVIIFVILTFMAVFSYLGARNKANEFGTETIMSNIAMALELYSIDNGAYPKNKNWATDLRKNGYIKEVPIKDMWGNDYVYFLLSNNYNSGYRFISYGIDGKSGGDDDIMFENGQQISFGKYLNKIKK